MTSVARLFLRNTCLVDYSIMNAISRTPVGGDSAVVLCETITKEARHCFDETKLTM